jgi:diguanylate cyclase (GGDEF)-like protein/PAS domain S-box-containing protein
MTQTLLAQHALAIVENCPIAVLVTDINERIISYNRAFECLVGRAQAEDLVGRNIAATGDHPAHKLLVEHKVCWTDRANTQRHFEIRHIDLTGEDSARARLFIDISRQVELEQLHDALNDELEQNTLTDPVTGLLNQRGVALALEPQVARSRRYNSPIAVIMMDVHCQQSDCENVHLHVARLLKDQMRWADLIGCTEQHEFMLILPETTAEAGLHLADKLQRRLQEMAEQEFRGEPVDARYGITGWRRSDNADTLLKRAGIALSRARSEQQNQPIAL